jgi:phosphoglycolate phosphatase-like HAD superfamily hydrolase
MMDIICDIDGTIADCSHRLHHITGGRKNWNEFFALTEHDTPIPTVVAVINALHKSGHRIIFCTARSEKTRSSTTQWLYKHVGKWTLEAMLYMRDDQDRRPDDQVKADCLVDMQQDGYKPTLALEDRSRVVDMWRQQGIQCFQVKEGNY